MTDDQLLEFADKWRRTHPGCAPWLDLTEDHFIKVARAIEQASRRAVLKEAASLVTAEDPRYSDWLYDDRELLADAIRALAAAPTATSANVAQGAESLQPNQIQVTHTIATAENAATILHGLLDSFIEVAAGFPEVEVDEALAHQARIYLPNDAAPPAQTALTDAQWLELRRIARTYNETGFPKHAREFFAALTAAQSGEPK